VHRDDGALRCIDCHGGSSLAGRLRVKALAAKDAFFYLSGRFEEPRAMRWPLWDEDCRKCHASFAERSSESWRSPGFHELAVHNARLGVGCVECHQVHESGGDPSVNFLDTGAVRAQCARCHSQFAEGG
jgi:nitrate/TMAO reductase-like tetraheme cytochrome c subunit